MKLSQHLIYSAVALGIVVASVALPTVVFGADRYAADTEKTACDFASVKSTLKEELRCNTSKTSCLIITDRALAEANIAIFTRQVCPGANPDIVKINGVWHSRYMCRGVLSQTRFAVVSYVPN